MCIVRGLTGFMTFMLAFGLRRMHGVGLYWYGLVLAGTGAGAIVGLVLVGRLRKRLTEQQLLLSSLWLIAVTAIGCAVWGTLFAQVVLAFMVGPVRCGGPAVLRRHDPALHPALGPGPRLRPLRHAPAAGVGGGLADPGDHRLLAAPGRRHHGRTGRARRALLRVGAASHPDDPRSCGATSATSATRWGEREAPGAEGPEPGRLSPGAARAGPPARRGPWAAGRRTARSTPG